MNVFTSSIWSNVTNWHESVKSPNSIYNSWCYSIKKEFTVGQLKKTGQIHVVTWKKWLSNTTSITHYPYWMYIVLSLCIRTSILFPAQCNRIIARNIYLTCKHSVKPQPEGDLFISSNVWHNNLLFCWCVSFIQTVEIGQAHSLHLERKTTHSNSTNKLHFINEHL